MSVSGSELRGARRGRGIKGTRVRGTEGRARGAGRGGGRAGVARAQCPASTRVSASGRHGASASHKWRALPETHSHGIAGTLVIGDTFHDTESHCVRLKGADLTRRAHASKTSVCTGRWGLLFCSGPTAGPLPPKPRACCLWLSFRVIDKGPVSSHRLATP